MKHSVFIVFVSVVTILYTLVNYFLFVKGYKLLPDLAVYKYTYSILFIALASLFIVNRVLLLTDVSFQPSIVYKLGGIWLAAVLYFLLIALGCKIISVADYFLHFLPNLQPYKFKILLSMIALVSGILIIGYINAKSPQLKTIQINIAKKTLLKSLKIAMVSDIHFGNIIGPDEIKSMLEKIKNENPDILIIAGDFVDEGVTPKLMAEIKPLFDSVRPKYGKIAILGNHEYINRIEHTLPIFGELGITLLRDSVLSVDGLFTVVGRDDYSSKQMYGVDRKTIKDLLKDVDTSRPVILIDHQPFALDETAKYPIDLQLSGHTHDGQMFPLNLLTKAIYEVSWGYKKKGNTNFYVSSGYGTWGPRVRLGNRPEIVIVNATFNVQ